MRQPRTMKELARDPRVDSIQKNGDGYWVFLACAIIEPELEVLMIREDTLRDVFDKLEGVRPLQEKDVHYNEYTGAEIAKAQAICALFRKR